LQTDGFDAATGLLVVGPLPAMPQLKAKPSREEAEAAVTIHYRKYASIDPQTALPIARRTTFVQPSSRMLISFGRLIQRQFVGSEKRRARLSRDDQPTQ
jgi:hypothetical protein